MCYFADFKKKLGERHNGNFGDLMNSPTNYDYVPRRRVRGFRELDSRSLKENSYVKVYTVPEPVVDPPMEDVNDIQFEVIDLDAEMERRKNSTSDSNPVQPDDSSVSKPLTMTVRSASNSPRRSVSQTQTRNGVTVATKVTGGNRAQRRATKKLLAKNAKAANKGKRKTVRGNSGSSPQAPKVVSLSDLEMGIRWE